MAAHGGDAFARPPTGDDPYRRTGGALALLSHFVLLGWSTGGHMSLHQVKL
jgi:hypothetical protein